MESFWKLGYALAVVEISTPWSVQYLTWVLTCGYTEADLCVRLPMLFRTLGLLNQMKIIGERIMWFRNGWTK